VDVGIIIGDTPVHLAPRQHMDLLLAQVRAATNAGVRCITIGQHFLYGEHRWLQPVPTLARLAGEVPPDVRLVTSVLLAPLYHPVVLAEELATLDIVTEGRLIVGLGLGYRTSEFEALGVSFADRAALFEACLAELKALWALPHIRPWQLPRPPLWIGADGPRGVRRAARLADAWMVAPTLPVDRVAQLWELFTTERAVAGLEPGSLPMRRDISFGIDRADSLATFLERAGPRLLSYAANERTDYDAPSAETIGRRLIHGTVQDCVDDVLALGSRLPVTTLIVRPHWTDMTRPELLDYLAQLGEVVEAVR
jgi:alkanesulfonate monooxygenase SsuD/methylene tetrahydromethanopterin reductase-like flavin-dependent oxidoreductase (luciferase family)